MHFRTLFSSVALLALLPTNSVATPGYEYTSQYLTAWEAVHQKLNLYPLIIDGKLWSLLPDLFTPDATANYTGFQPNAAGIPAIQAGLEAAVATFDSQHLFGTTLINLDPGCEEANATVYVQATLFAKPQLSPGQVVYVYAYYADHLVLTAEGWRIDKRVFQVMGPGLAGNLTLVGK